MNPDLFEQFMEYHKANPSLRFWQCVRAFTGVSFVLTAEIPDFPNGWKRIKDTYFFTEKDK